MGKLPASEKLIIKGPAGRLEALLETPKDTAPVGSAVVCHPHPLHGGAMNNKVTHTLSRAFGNCNLISLRFNFRGVGQSDGAFDDGRGEVDDVLAAVAWMRDRGRGLPLWLAGFSFGAAMAVRAAVESDPAGLVSIAPATSRFGGAMSKQPRCPWLIIQGDKDELVPVEETIGWVNDLQPGPELEIFPDTEHFFHGRLVRLRDSVEDFIRLHAAS